MYIKHYLETIKRQFWYQTIYLRWDEKTKTNHERELET